MAKINQVFTQKGAYATGPDANDVSTFVDIHGYNDTPDGTGVHATPGGTSAGDPSCRGACTITITDAGVLGAPIGGKGRLAGTVSCTSLAAAGVGCVKCAIAPMAIAFDIADCSHSD